MIVLDEKQDAMVEWLIRMDGRGLLWADAGVGKTFVALEVAKRLLAPGNVPAGRVLVLCPSVLKGQWRDEAAKYLGATATVVDGPRERRVEQWREGRFLTIANYDLLDRDIDLILQCGFRMVIADESHMLKSPTAKRYKAFRRIEPEYRLALSGTPIPNDLWEIWTTADWIRPGILGRNFYSFRSAWCVMNPFIPGAIVGYRNEGKLRDVVQSIAFRAVRGDVEGMAGLVTSVVEVDLSAEEKSRYAQLKDEMRLMVAGKELTATNALSQLMRLRQLVDDPRVLGLPEEGTKEKALHGILADGVKTIVFTEFKTLAARLGDRYGCGVISGDVSSSDRDAALRRFKGDPAARILVSTSAGQYGLNLQEADRVVHFGVPWNWARVDQRASRARRRGREGDVAETFLFARATVDVKMWKLVNRKRELGEKLSNAEIAAVLDEELSEPF